jgi:cytochrome c peroxidase
MHPTTLTRLTIVCLMSVLPLAGQNVSAQNSLQVEGQGDGDNDDDGDNDHPHPTPTPPVYNPYPAGFLPANLNAEIERVNREIDGIENEALQQWHQLPINPGTAKRQVEILGKLEQFDKNLSVNKNMACTFCHMPYTGFSGPIPSLNATTVAYPGSARFRFGKRKPQGYTYSPYYPTLQFNETQHNFYGGNFWDLRATGFKIQSADSEQAQGPPHDTQEMGLPDTACVVYRLSQARYRSLFETVWGRQAFDIHWPHDVERVCSTPGGASVFHGNPTPLDLSPKDRGRADATYDQFAHAVTAYEYSPDTSPFSSKFDAFLHGDVQLTQTEQAGYNLFRGKANCNSCHLDGRSTALMSGQSDNGAAASVAPLFTDFTSSNLGLPKNPRNPFYFQNVPDPFGFTPNPAGMNFKDLGVGLFLRSLSGTNPDVADWAPLAPQFDGFMQVSTCRNVDMRPRPNFVKAYMHNGYLKSLKEVVHFYNTRDVYPFPVTSGNCPPGTVEKVNCWPMPEVPQTKDMTIGHLGLTDQEENQIVAFLQTLTDGFTRPYTDFNTYTGP